MTDSILCVPVQIVNPILIVIMVPIMDNIVYPLIKKCHLNFTWVQLGDNLHDLHLIQSMYSLYMCIYVFVCGVFPGLCGG